MSTKPTPTVREGGPLGVVPPPELLARFSPYGPDAVLEVLRTWREEHRANFIYSLIALIISGLLGMALIAGFVYLVMNNHPAAAASLLGGGALSMVAGFRTVRLRTRAQESRSARTKKS